MATFTDTVRFVVEAVTGSAERNLKGLRGEMAQTEGATGKLKAGVGQLGGFLKQNVALGAAGAATALAGFAAKAIGDFQELALSADKFAASSGLAVEDASRWAEVVGDIGVAQETIAGAANKLNLAASKGFLEELGITSDDANERLTLTIEYLGSIDDEAERARQATKLLGKSWTELAPLIESSDTLRENLAGVGDAQVIDQDEVDKAKRYRDAMDSLNDSFAAVSIELGETLVPLMATLADLLAKILETSQRIQEGGGLAEVLGFDVPDWLEPLIPFTTGGLDPRTGQPGVETGPQPISNAVKAPPGTPGVSVGSTTIINNYPPSTDGRETDAALQEYWRKNGRG